MSTPTNQQLDDLRYIKSQLLMEFQRNLDMWNKEYTQPRDLGVRGEFANLYRKARKLKSIYWDGHDPANWREGSRTMFMEIAAHAFLAIRDLDMEAKSDQDKEPYQGDDDDYDGGPVFHAPDQTKWLVTASFDPNKDTDRQWSLNVERIEDQDVPF